MARAITNRDLGECPCPTCGHDAKVRKSVANKLYLVCTNCNRDGLQEYILQNSALYGPTGPLSIHPTQENNHVEEKHTAQAH